MPTTSGPGNDALGRHAETAVRPTLDLSESLAHVQRLIARALSDLRDARRRGHVTAETRAEGRMNALLDLFAKRARKSLPASQVSPGRTYCAADVTAHARS